VAARTAGEADDAQGISLFVVEAGAAGVSLHPYAVMGGGVAADLQLDGVEVAAEARWWRLRCSPSLWMSM